MRFVDNKKNIEHHQSPSCLFWALIIVWYSVHKHWHMHYRRSQWKWSRSKLCFQYITAESKRHVSVQFLASCKSGASSKSEHNPTGSRATFCSQKYYTLSEDKWNITQTVHSMVRNLRKTDVPLNWCRWFTTKVGKVFYQWTNMRRQDLQCWENRLISQVLMRKGSTQN